MSPKSTEYSYVPEVCRPRPPSPESWAGSLGRRRRRVLYYGLEQVGHSVLRPNKGPAALIDKEENMS